MRSSWIKMSPKPKDEGLYKRKREDTEMQGWSPRGDGGRDWSDTSTSQGVPRFAGNHQELGDRQGQRFSPRATKAANTLISDFGSPEPWENKVVLSHPVCEYLLQKPQKTNTPYYPDYLITAFFIGQYITSILNLLVYHNIYVDSDYPSKDLDAIL